MVEGWIGSIMSFNTLMNDRQKEVAAKELCRLKGMDPNQLMAYPPDPNNPGQVSYKESWKLAVKLIEAQEQLETAMNKGRSTKA